MLRIFLSVSLLMLSLCSGCAICSSCDDYNYSAFGGVRERADRSSGRINSVFAPAEFVEAGDGSVIVEDDYGPYESYEEVESLPGESVLEGAY